jgi:hypothetical protein
LPCPQHGSSCRTLLPGLDDGKSERIAIEAKCAREILDGQGEPELSDRAVRADELALADASRDMYQGNLAAAGFGRIATEIALAGPFFVAAHDHQEHLDTNPNGYGPDYNTGVACPTESPS